METYTGQFKGILLTVEIAPMTQEIYERDFINALPWPHSNRMDEALTADRRFVSYWNGRLANFGTVAQLRPRQELGFIRH